jgi:hypothetical protein
MPDFTKMTLESLRAVARKVLGPGHARKTKAQLVAALRRAQQATAPAGAPSRRAAAAGRARPGKPEKAPARAAQKVAKAARAAGGVARKARDAVRDGARAVGKAGKAAGRIAEGAAAGAKEAKVSSAGRGRKPGKVAAAVAAVAGAAAGAAAGVAAARKAARAGRKPRTATGPKAPPIAEGPDPDGYFVARVRGEDALRDAPHPMAEAVGDGWPTAEEAMGATVYDERLGDLPWGYGDDAFVALPRDPRTLFLYWDWAQQTLARAFEGLDRPRTQLWVFAGAGEGWDRVRVLEFALESRGFYVHDLEPGRTYRAEIHLVDRSGRERLLAASSNPCALPPAGPSPIVDDRFVRIPWDLPLGQLLGPGHAGSPFSDDLRAQLARLSDWSRFSGPTWGGSAGGMGGRPSSPSSGPSSPSSPFGGGR